MKAILILNLIFLVCSALGSPTTSKPKVSGKDTAEAATDVNSGDAKGKNKTADFNEVEMDRLCPSDELDTLKSIHKNKSECGSGGMDYWHKKCLCHYSKKIRCPECPGKSVTTMMAVNGSSYFTFGPKSLNATILYQFPVFKIHPNGTDEFGTANKFNIYNTAGGTINLYFYQTGKPHPGQNGTGSKTQGGPKNKTSTTTTTEIPSNLDAFGSSMGI